MQNESLSSKLQPAKDDVSNADAFSTVLPHPVPYVETENLTRNPQAGFCNWCRNKPGDIFCDNWPCCWDCLELMLDRERAIAIADVNGFGVQWRSEYYH